MLIAGAAARNEGAIEGLTAAAMALLAWAGTVEATLLNIVIDLMGCVCVVVGDRIVGGSTGWWRGKR